MSPQAASRADLEACFAAALAAVDPAAALRRVVTRASDGLAIAGRPLPRAARLRVLAAGKAACAMAAALEAVASDALVEGLAVTKDGHGLPLRRFVVREAGHPVPDARGAAAAAEALALAGRAGPEAVLGVLLSGGASALLSRPLPGLSLEDLAATTRALLAAGATIEELNAVRKHLGAVGGGRLARAAAGAARIEVLVVSDVLGDPLDVIGSGPCAADPTRFADALAVLEARGVADRVPEAVRGHLARGVRGELPESLKPGDPILAKVTTTLLASNRDALAGAAAAARARGLRPCIVSRALRGEASRIGRALGGLARALRPGPPVLLLAGGEPTVTLRGDGRGGRAQELALAAALELAGTTGVTLLAAGTDGSDGPTDAAGAFADGGTVARGAARGAEARAALARNDSHGFFRAEGGCFFTGPTRTNVMDLVLVEVDAAARAAGASR